MSTIKTIDTKATSWKDKVMGNHYVAMEVVVNSGMKSQERFRIPGGYCSLSSIDHEVFKSLQERYNELEGKTSFLKAYKDLKIKWNTKIVEGKKKDVLK